jgi:hypothetical protein
VAPWKRIMAKKKKTGSNIRPPARGGASRGRKKPSIRAIDLFCGVGGLTHGLVKGGVNVVAGIDLEPDS